MTIGDRAGMADTRQAMERKGVFDLAQKRGLETIVFDEISAEQWQYFDQEGTHWQKGFAIARPILDDESCKQLISEIQPPLTAKPGQLERFDDQYEREGVCNLFMLFEPLKAWRHVEVTAQRTSIDYAKQMKYLVDECYPEAQKIRVVQDNLNPHVKASLYKAFLPGEARRILDQLEFYYPPKPGSWLNMAEIEFSILNRQCLNRRIACKETLIQEVEAWEQQRNQTSSAFCC